MKKFYLFHCLAFIVIAAFFSTQTQAQGGVYFNEGFAPTSAWASAVANSIPFQEVNVTSGKWYTFGSYRSNGPTGSCTSQTGDPSHLRLSNLASVQPGYTTADSAFVLTPLVSSGIFDLKFYNGRSGRRLSIYKTTATEPTTTDWSLVAFIPSDNAACDLETVLVNDANAVRLKIVVRSGTDTDIDSVIMTSTGTLPSQLGGINAQSNEAGVLVAWNASNESNVKGYFLQRSDDGGVTFKDIYFAASTNRLMAKYSFTDKNAGAGLLYYRIKAVDLNGSTSFSKIVKINLRTTNAAGFWVVNPLVGNSIDLQLNNLPKGSYSITLLDPSGRQVLVKNVELQGSKASFAMPLSHKVAKGIYLVSLRGIGVTINKRVLID